MHALARMSQETGEERYLRWAVDLAAVAHQFFTYEVFPGGPKRMVWKMSIDLSRPMVNSMGHHDPLDGLITCLELRVLQESPAAGPDLDAAIVDFTQMCQRGRWATDDPLGIGGLLDDAVRLAHLVVRRGIEQRDLLVQLLEDVRSSLAVFAGSRPWEQPPERRLPFRELGLSIGLHGVPRIAELTSQDRDLADLTRGLLGYQPLAERIESLWSRPVHQNCRTWTEHGDINTVMLATSLAPEGYLGL